MSTTMKLYQRLLLLIVLLLSLTPAQAGVSVLTGNKYVFNNGGATVTTSGGTYAPTVAIATDQAVRLRATAIYSSSSGGHLQYAGSLTAEYFVQNSNGTLTAVTAGTNSQNPTNSSTVVVSSAMTGEFVQVTNQSNLNGINTLVWTVSGTNAICTYTNNSTTSATYITIYVETYAAGST